MKNITQQRRSPRRSARDYASGRTRGRAGRCACGHVGAAARSRARCSLRRSACDCAGGRNRGRAGRCGCGNVVAAARSRARLLGYDASLLDL